MASVDEIEAPFGAPDVQWEKCTENRPENAVVCGDSEGKPVYAGRVRFEKDILIGTVNTDKKSCVFAANGVAHESKDYEVMTVACGDPLEWEAVEKDDENDERDSNILPCGIKKTGDVLYVGRLVANNKTFIGWVDLEKKEVHVAKDGAEQVSSEFQILIHKHLHRICICPPCPPDYSPPRF